MNKYRNKSYLSLERIQAYLEQYILIQEGNGVSILEIGKGAGFFESLVSLIGYHYVSVDCDKKTKPGIISSVTNLPLPNASFDYVYCCQVLEHLTFDKFPQAVSELCRIGKKKIIISVPDNRKFFRFTLHIPKIKIRKVVSIPFTGRHISRDDHGEHHWEIGGGRYKNCVSESRVLELLHRAPDLKTIDHYRFYERPYQHFFVLTKEENS